MTNPRLGTKGTWQLREDHTYAPPGQSTSPPRSWNTTGAILGATPASPRCSPATAFTLLPGEERQLRFTAKGPAPTLAQFEQALTVRHLRATYQ